MCATQGSREYRYLRCWKQPYLSSQSRAETVAQEHENPSQTECLGMNDESFSLMEILADQKEGNFSPLN